MKGIVFSELFGLIENQHGYEFLDSIISQCQLPNQGAYTSVGTYDFCELASIAVAYGERTNTELPVLLKAFGRHLFGQFASKFEDLCLYPDAFSLLKEVDSIIHVEVRKLYPSAELPEFTYNDLSDEVLEMHYQSTRPLADLCEGLIEACIEHFDEPIEISRHDNNDENTDSTFRLTKTSA